MRVNRRLSRWLAVGLLCGSAVVWLLARPTAAAQDDAFAGALWTVEFPANIEWHRSTLYDVPLIQTERGLTGINGATGEKLWELPGLVVERDDVNELVDLLLINARDGTQGNRQARALAVDVLTGAVRWESPDITGRTLTTAESGPCSTAVRRSEGGDPLI